MSTRDDGSLTMNSQADRTNFPILAFWVPQTRGDSLRQDAEPGTAFLKRTVPGNIVIPIAYSNQSIRGTPLAMVLSYDNERCCKRYDRLKGPRPHDIASFDFWCFRWQVGRSWGARDNVQLEACGHA